MAYTYQAIVDLARMPLNDEDKVRYSDAQLLKFANQGTLALSKRRPDLFVGQFHNLPTGEAALADFFPIEAAYAQVLADWIVARAEMADDEHANSGRAQAFVNLFGSEAGL